jgi:dUTP pyrophosphatase
MKVNVINKSSNELPTYAKAGDWGQDVRADFSRGVSDKFMFGAAYDEEREVINLFSGGRCLIPTGIFTSFPPGYEIQVRSRSGLALKDGIIVLNSPGTIDPSYRGELGIILFNTSDEVFEIAHGDRIAQIGLVKVSLIEWNEVEALDESDRGKGGFGSSGIK